MDLTPNDMDYTTNDLASEDCGYWATLKKIRLQASVFSFKDHEYQVEPMRFTGRRKCVMKGTQGGFTEDEVLDSLHGMRYKHLPQGVLYLFPTSDDVDEFSKSRFNPLIVANPQAIGKYVKSGGKGTDTARLKKIHNAFLYLRGARLSQKISDVNESSKLKSIPVDRVVFDEIDHMDEDVKAKALGRMGHSKVKQERYLSNPLVPGEGIDRIFSASDQRHWFRRCGCGEWTCAELSFPDCVKIRSDGTGYIGCNKCGKEVPIAIWVDNDKMLFKNAEWVPAVPANSDFMHGYRWSQLTSVFNDPAEILQDFSNPPEGNLADVYRLRLGLPYIAAEDRLTEAQIYGCCGQEIQANTHTGPCAAGVDVGKIKHVVIGPKTGNDQYKVVKVSRLSEWNDILDSFVKLNVKSAVVDIRPYEDSAREFQAKAKRVGIKVYLCEYKENAVSDYVYNDNTGIVAANRTQIFDATHRMVTTPGMLTIPRYCPEIKEFAKQVCGAYKVLETNKKSGTSIYRYKGANDHYRNALNYFKLAASGHKIATVSRYKTNKQENVISEYARI